MSQLTLALLGAFRAEGAGAALSGFESDKVRALLAYLVVESGRPHRRGALAALLWPERPERAALLNLNQAVANLRRVVGDRGAAVPLILSARESVQLNPAAELNVDVAAFGALLDACATHAHRSPSACGPCAARRAEAVALYAGPFLDSLAPRDCLPFEEWALLVRERLHRRMLAALADLAAYHEGRADYYAALAATYRLLELEPWREEAHRQVMVLLWRDGQRSAALAQYERCRAILAEELGVEPEPATDELYRALLAGDRPDREADRGAAIRPQDAGSRPPGRQVSLAVLPAPTTPFVGRAEELALLAERLGDPACRLVSIVGLGGSGKTRLATQAAAAAEGFADGVQFVPLAAVERPDELLPAIARAFGLAPGAADDARAQLHAHLRSRTLLLVIDNLEQLRPAAPALVELLEAAPGLTMLTTSRERLGLSGEWALDLGGLALPAGSTEDELERHGASALFLGAARRARGSFAPDEAERRAIMRICRALGGHPLAIELAAAWTNLLSCAALEGELAQGLALLASDSPDRPERQRTLEAVLTATWAHLAPAERRALMLLAVFPASFGREAAEAVLVGGLSGPSPLGTSPPSPLSAAERGCRAERGGGEVCGGMARPKKSDPLGAKPGAPLATLGTLAALMNRALLQRAGEGRYAAHTFIRQYAAERLRESGEADEAQRRMLAYGLALVEAAEAHLKTADEATWLDRLEAEHATICAGLDWALARGEAEQVARLGVVLRWFWYIRGYIGEGRRRVEACVALAREAAVAPSLLARLLQGAGVLADEAGDYAAAAAHYEESLAIFGRLGDKNGVRIVTNSLGVLHNTRGHHAEARICFEVCLHLSRELGNAYGAAISLNNLGTVAQALDEPDGALAHFAEGLAVARSIGYTVLTATLLGNIGDAALAAGELPRAMAAYGEALELQRSSGDTRGAALALRGIGLAALERGEPDAAAEALYEGLALMLRGSSRRDLIAALDAVAVWLAAQGRHAEAARLCGAAAACREQIGAPATPAEARAQATVVARCRLAIGELPFVAAWASGRAMPIERAGEEVIAARRS